MAIAGRVVWVLHLAGDCVVLLGKIHYFHNVSLHPGV